MDNSKFWAKKDSMKAFGRVRVIVITHPRKAGHAVISVQYPAVGAGVMHAFCEDHFADEFHGQYGKAGGYGYDKLTAALSGFVIDGHTLTDHCGEDDKSRMYLRAYGRTMTRQGEDAAAAVVDRAKKAGYSFSNWTSGGGYRPNEWDGYQSCYKLSGLDYLSALGYRVLNAM